MGYVEFADKAARIAAAAVAASGQATLQDDAAILFDGLCLVAD